MMSSEVARIADQLRRSVEGGAWHGPALLEVRARQAVARPIAAAHSIWELVLHLWSWTGVEIERLAGKTLEEPAAGDWPAVTDVSETAWKETLRRLKAAQRKLLAAVERLPESRLEEQAPGRDHTIYFMLHGQVQHTLYHAGQIALLKKTKS
ncbi:MAG: DinB family protein [Acidobacteria bacterium]|nr:DinB family protein [Acidobacteriota bacterium]